MSSIASRRGSCSLTADHPGSAVTVSSPRKRVVPAVARWLQRLKLLIRGEVCLGGACIVSARGAGRPCRVFLSSILASGNLGGLIGVDAKCQGLATAAGLPGTSKAWLSDSTSSPVSRFVPSIGPYRLVNGTTIAATWIDSIDGTLAAPINVTEGGGGVGAGRFAWTHTKSDGPIDGVANEHCSNWSTNAAAASGAGIGYAQHSDSTWTDLAGSACNQLYQLYRFQQS